MKRPPATRIGRTILFPDGSVATLHWWERLLFALGWKTTIKTARKEPCRLL